MIGSSKEKTTLIILFTWLIVLTTGIIFIISHKNTDTGKTFSEYSPIEYEKQDSEKQEIKEKINALGNDLKILNDKQIMVYAKALTKDVKAPDSMDFAGEPVPLHRIDVAEALIRELTVNTYMHSSTLTILKKFPRVSKIVYPILKEENVPEDIIYLAICESALNELAVSPAQAVGMWQFISSTAKEYDLEINSSVDERYNIEKETRAACRYLKDGKEKFGSWTLAAAAYNCGFQMVSKQQDKQKFKSYYDLLLPMETNRYMFRILAFKEIVSHPEKYNFRLSTPFEDEPCTKIKVESKIKDLAEWAIAQGISYKTLKRFNPWMRDNYLNASTRHPYEIRIPVNKNRYQ